MIVVIGWCLDVHKVRRIAENLVEHAVLEVPSIQFPINGAYLSIL